MFQTKSGVHVHVCMYGANFRGNLKKKRDFQSRTDFFPFILGQRFLGCKLILSKSIDMSIFMASRLWEHTILRPHFLAKKEFTIYLYRGLASKT